jgi:hypothetical protein
MPDSDTRRTRRRIAPRALTAALAAALACAAAPRTAVACGNVITLTVNELARRVTAAEKLLTAGSTVGAVQTLRFALAIARGRAAREFGGYELEGDLRAQPAMRVRARAERLFALAVVRRDGVVDRPRMRASWVPESVRVANLVWAEGALAAAMRERPDAPEAIAQHAEALERLPNRAAEAMNALRELDRRDLVPDGWAYAALARLSSARRDPATRDRALARCATLAGEHAQAVCSLTTDASGR